jgi:hypothetical protein
MPNGREMDNPADDGRHGAGKIFQPLPCRRVVEPAQGEAQDDGPSEDADIVGVHEGRDRIVYEGQDQIVEYLDNPARRSQFRIRRDLQHQAGREEETHDYADDGSAEGAQEIQFDDGTDAARGTFLFLGHGVHD